MLRIACTDSDWGRRWELCGRLAGPWVEELRSCWQQWRSTHDGGRAMVELKDVTFIDERGEALLTEMRRAGVKFVAAGMETRHLIQHLKIGKQKPLRRVMEHLTGACGDGSAGGGSE